MDEDPLSFLQHGTKEDIMTFLKWRLDEYRVLMNVDDVFLVLHHYWVMDTATFPNRR
jgi:hypothetical protein